MTQITETIESELNELLARLPDRIEFNFGSVMKHIHSHSSYLQNDNVIRGVLENIPEHRNLSWEETGKLTSCFKFEMSPDLEIDLESGRMSGTLALVKVIPTLPDEELQTLMGARGIEA